MSHNPFDLPPDAPQSERLRVRSLTMAMLERLEGKIPPEAEVSRSIEILEDLLVGAGLPCVTVESRRVFAERSVSGAVQFRATRAAIYETARLLAEDDEHPAMIRHKIDEVLEENDDDPMGGMILAEDVEDAIEGRPLGTSRPDADAVYARRLIAAFADISLAQGHDEIEIRRQCDRLTEAINDGLAAAGLIPD